MFNKFYEIVFEPLHTRMGYVHLDSLCLFFTGNRFLMQSRKDVYNDENKFYLTNVKLVDWQTGILFLFFHKQIFSCIICKKNISCQSFCYKIVLKLYTLYIFSKIFLMLEKTFKYKKSTLPFAAPHALHVLHEHVSGHWHSAPQLHSVSVHPQGLLQMAHAQSVVLHWQVSPQLHAPLAQVQFVSIN